MLAITNPKHPLNQLQILLLAQPQIPSTSVDPPSSSGSAPITHVASTYSALTIFTSRLVPDALSSLPLFPQLVLDSSGLPVMTRTPNAPPNFRPCPTPTSANSDASPANSDASPANSDASPANSDASPANSDASPANSDASPANSDASPANSDASPANSDASPANSDASPANSDASPANSDASPANSDASPANSDASPANSDASPANSDASPANSDASPANSDASPANSDASPANSDASPANSDASPANSDASPANSDASPANSDASPANSDASPANSDASPANSDASPANSDASPANSDASPANSDASPANSDGPLANFGACPTATDTYPGPPELREPPPLFPIFATHHQLNTLVPLTYFGVSQQPRGNPRSPMIPSTYQRGTILDHNQHPPPLSSSAKPRRHSRRTPKSSVLILLNVTYVSRSYLSLLVLSQSPGLVSSPFRYCSRYCFVSLFESTLVLYQPHPISSDAVSVTPSDHCAQVFIDLNDLTNSAITITDPDTPLPGPNLTLRSVPDSISSK
ncbi:hypothetical protein J132_04008 [Termitomyces sp. J132]|nr:hypothetical protein J132_04008 [Termitomyces sp. J132]